MAYRRKTYEYTTPSYTTYSTPTSTVRKEVTTTTTERSYELPRTQTVYETTTTTTRARPPIYTDYRPTITTSTHNYSPRWYDTNSTTRTTKIGPYGVTTRTYRY
ncbi:hypothetical protein CHUAL_007194 [Chamberlinius hualienensis]